MTNFIHISEAASIAVHVCLALATDRGGRFRPVHQLAEEYGFSKHHVAKVVKRLEKAGFIETGRGPSGGARWLGSAEDVSLYDIYFAADGTPGATRPCILNERYCDGTQCVFGRMLAQENLRLQHALRKTSLADVMRSTQLAAPRRKLPITIKKPTTPKTKEKK